jgi:hypothetical protein
MSIIRVKSTKNVGRILRKMKETSQLVTRYVSNYCSVNHFIHISNIFMAWNGQETQKIILMNQCLLLLRNNAQFYSTSWEVAGSIPDEVIGYFNELNLSSRTMALRSPQPLEEISTRNLIGGKGRPERKADLTVIC